ncbi:LuxR C-terminal-related transcriptional regulator [Agromyces sp. NPDC049794]|uniref:LuxR C-terminal-related transcriptional regulator n=1 Tax=unclassified Agromyces TaxID=2639701 RepID=UPI0033FAF95D
MVAGAGVDESRAGRVSSSLSALPADTTSFVGRRRDVDRLRRRLADSRLLTLTGPGGIGKTRLAIEVARRSVRRFAGGTFFVELAGLREPGLLLPTIARAVGVGEFDGESTIAAIADRLGESGSLLILDNFEQIVSAGPDVGRLLAASPTLRVLVTSRIPTHLAGEKEFRVASLEIPDPGAPASPEVLGRVEALTLFVERARAIRPGFALTERSAQAIAQICRRLDGLPLAIELAAARTKVLSAEALLQRLERGLPALAVGPADAPERQRTVEATITWSYELLDFTERQTFGRLGVFVGGFDLTASEYVLAGSVDGPDADALDQLSRLVDHSLLQVDSDEDGEVRFRMLEPIRRFALDQLSVADSVSVQDRHLEWCIGLAEAVEGCGNEYTHGERMRRLVAERDNIRAALAHALERGDGDRLLRLAGALDRRFWLAIGDLDLSESRRWLEVGLELGVEARGRIRAGALQRLASTHALSSSRWRSALEEALAEYGRTGDEVGMAEAMCALGLTDVYRGDLTAADARLRRGLELARRAGAPLVLHADLRASLGLLAYRRRDEGLGRDEFEEALQLARTSGDAVSVATALGHLGRLAMTEADGERAQRLLAERVELARVIDDPELLTWALTDLASERVASGELDTARALVLEAAQASSRLNWWFEVMVLDALAQWLCAAGELDEAARCLSAADRTRPDTEMNWDPDRVSTRTVLADRTRSVMHRTAFDAAWDDARVMSRAAVMDRALTAMRAADIRQREATRRARGNGGLSPRELEVLGLIVDGRSDGEIAEELTISKKTASVHVAHIKDKLGAGSRVEIATEGIRLGLVHPLGLDRTDLDRVDPDRG